MKAFRNFVNGAWVDAADGRTTPVIDPSTGEQYAKAALSGAADVEAAMRAAAAAFEGWRDATPSERSLALIRIADAIEARGDEIMHLECENTGKPYSVTVARRSARWSTRSGSSPVPPAISRARPPPST